MDRCVACKSEKEEADPREREAHAENRRQLELREQLEQLGSANMRREEKRKWMEAYDLERSINKDWLMSQLNRMGDLEFTRALRRMRLEEDKGRINFAFMERM
jgi:hypothetical protein